MGGNYWAGTAWRRVRSARRRVAAMEDMTVGRSKRLTVGLLTLSVVLSGTTVVPFDALALGTPASAGVDGYRGTDDATGGSVEWNTSTGGWVETTPAVVDRTAYLGSWDGTVYAMNTRDLPDVRVRYSEGTPVETALPVDTSVSAKCVVETGAPQGANGVSRDREGSGSSQSALAGKHRDGRSRRPRPSVGVDSGAFGGARRGRRSRLFR